MKAILIMIGFMIVFLCESYMRNGMSVSSDVFFFYLAWMTGGVTAIVIDRNYIKRR